jgi:hypothetical protein
MILRFTSKEGGFRLTVEPTTTFPELLPQIAEKLPKSVDLQSVTVSNRPQGGDARKISELTGVSFEKVGLACVCRPQADAIANSVPGTEHSCSSPLKIRLQYRTAMLQLPRAPIV